MKKGKDLKLSISIFDKGEYIGNAIIEFDYSNGALMAVYEIDFPDKKVDVLFISDMQYGIVISKNIAEKIRGICRD